MFRPITWALGIVAMAAIGATWTGSRLSDALDRSALSARAERGQAPARPTASPTERTLSVQADLGGHFLVHPMVEGRRLRMLVDTGATLVALTYEDAVSAGIRIDPSRRKRMSTANGTLDAAAVRILEMRLGDILVRNVDAVVMPPGRLDTSLLGMSFLRGLRGFEIAQGRLLLKG